MLLYLDIFSGDVMMTDFDVYAFKEVNDVIVEIDCAMVPVFTRLEIDQKIEETDCSEINIVKSFRLRELSLDKKLFYTYVRSYLQQIKVYLSKHAPDQIEAFQKPAHAHLKKVLDSFDDWELYTGESGDVRAMIVMLSYREDGTPFVAMWKHGLKAVKPSDFQVLQPGYT